MLKYKYIKNINLFSNDKSLIIDNNKQSKILNKKSSINEPAKISTVKRGLP